MTDEAETQRRRAVSDALLEEVRRECDDEAMSTIKQVLIEAAEAVDEAGEKPLRNALAVGAACVAIVSDLLVEQAEAKEPTP